mgnify:FL=1
MKFSSDLMRVVLIRRLVRLPFLQFLFILPVTAVVVLASISMIYGIRHPGFNFGLVITWVVWWGLLIGLFAVVGRGWCFMCPFGAVVDWLQRRSLWWKTKWGLGFDFKYPRRLQNLWLAIALFIGFIFLDAGYGISNNPALTAGLVVVLFLWAMWIAFLYERRTFCRYQCPLTVFIGMSSMFAPFEIRSKDAEVCQQCQTKDCYRGNEHSYGCPTFEFPGGGMDSNRDCILCTECIKACPKENVTMRLRMWGRDLWARRKARLDESVAAIVLAAIVTMVSLVLVLFLPKVYFLMRPILPAGKPPNDWPRLVSIAIIYLGGIALALLLFYGFSYLSRLFSGVKDTKTRAIFTHFGYAVIPLGVMKFLSDILDHIFRTWGAVMDVTRALIRDFPLNRLMLEGVTVKQLMSAEQTYLLQIGMIGIGFGFSLYIAFKLAGRLFPERTTAFRAFLPIGAFIFILTMAAVWALSAAL